MTHQLTRVRVVVPGLLIATFAAACGGSSGGSSPSTVKASGQPAASTSAPAATTATVTTHSGPSGTFLTDGKGRALYVFSADHGTTSACTGACLGVWPPFTATSTPHASGDARSGMLNVVMQKGGADQVTYNGHLLYYYSGDSSPGDTTGQGITNFGGTWNLVSPAGKAIASGGGASSSPSSQSGSGASGNGWG